jgi:hypothetical protein
MKRADGRAFFPTAKPGAYHLPSAILHAVSSIFAATRAALGLLILLALSPALAQEPWQAALNRMPLSAGITQLTRTGAVDVLWHAFRSNGVVKGMVLMPGATDIWYMFEPASVVPTNAHPTRLDAINALTNQTRIRVTLRPPLLLLHADWDVLEAAIKVADSPTAARLKQARFVPHAVFNDPDWDFVQPILSKSLKTAMRPWRHSRESWHFYRHSFVGWDLTGWEAIEATALAAKTTCTVHRNKVVFEVDRRPSPLNTQSWRPGS